MRHIIKYNSKEARKTAYRVWNEDKFLLEQLTGAQYEINCGYDYGHDFYTTDREELSAFVSKIDSIFSEAGLRMRDYSIITEGV